MPISKVETFDGKCYKVVSENNGEFVYEPLDMSYSFEHNYFEDEKSDMEDDVVRFFANYFRELDEEELVDLQTFIKSLFEEISEDGYRESRRLLDLLTMKQINYFFNLNDEECHNYFCDMYNYLFNHFENCILRKSKKYNRTVTEFVRDGNVERTFF
jgi:DNA-binding protein Fis